MQRVNKYYFVTYSYFRALACVKTNTYLLIIKEIIQYINNIIFNFYFYILIKHRTIHGKYCRLGIPKFFGRGTLHKF